MLLHSAAHGRCSIDRIHAFGDLKSHGDLQVVSVFGVSSGLHRSGSRQQVVAARCLRMLRTNLTISHRRKAKMTFRDSDSREKHFLVSESENDPAAGSPTATLLRLLPLLDCKYRPDSIQKRVAPSLNLQRALLTTHYRQRRAVCTRTRDVFAAF